MPTPTEKAVLPLATDRDKHAIHLLMHALRHHFHPDGAVVKAVSPELRHRAMELALRNKVGWHARRALQGDQHGDEMTQYIAGVAVRNALMSRHAAEISTALSKKSIRHILIKGVSQQRIIYGDNSVRASADVDILVTLRSFASARNIVRQLGYHMLTPSLWWWGFLGEQHLVKFTPFQVSIDLHRQLHQPGVPGLRHAGDLLARVRHVDLAGASVPVLDRPDIELLLVISICKATLSRETNTGYITDLFALLMADVPHSVNSLLTRASREGLAGHVRLALRMIDLVFGVTFSPSGGKVPLRTVDDEALLDMIMTPDAPHLVWPRRRTLIAAFCDGDPLRTAGHLGLTYASELARRLFERGPNAANGVA